MASHGNGGGLANQGGAKDGGTAKQDSREAREGLRTHWGNGSQGGAEGGVRVNGGGIKGTGDGLGDGCCEEVSESSEMIQEFFQASRPLKRKVKSCAVLVSITAGMS